MHNFQATMQKMKIVGLNIHDKNYSSPRNINPSNPLTIS